MELPVEQLRTFAIIVREGSFEAAARTLHITPSAVSQRVRAMEERVGSVLLQRTRPVAVTEVGTAVLRAARQVERIVDDVARELGDGPAGGAVIPLLVNADSLATWFMPALARAVRDTGARFEVLLADETISADQLRRGEAMGAVTAAREPVPGCATTRLGVVRYRALASPEFAAQYFSSGVSAASLTTAPMLEFDRHDVFQQRFLRKVTRTDIDPPRHYIPSSAEFARAIELGMGWGMLPDLQCERQLTTGRLIELGPDSAIRLPLYWQRWNLSSPVLDTLTRIIAEEAATALK